MNPKFVVVQVEQVSGQWPVIRKAFDDGTPGIELTEESYVGIMRAYMNGLLTAVYALDDDNPGLPIAVATLMNSHDTILDTKSVVIYSLAYYLDKEDAEALWPKLFEALTRYAKNKGCRFVKTSINDPWLLKQAKSVGASTTVRLVEWEI